MSRVRERLLATAAELFYQNGITATGVDHVVEAARVSKPALYSHFGSKSGLVAAVLQERHRRRTVELATCLQRSGPDPWDQLAGVFSWLGDLHSRAAGRGCAFLNAAAEIPDPADPAREIIATQKSWFRELLADLASRLGAADPERVGGQIMLLIEGANSKVLVDGDLAAASAAYDAAVVLLRAAGRRCATPR